MIYQLNPLEIHLPQIVSNDPLIHSVRSQSFGDEVYRVDVRQYSCTCPDWKALRFDYPLTDARRACKHISLLLNILPFRWVLPLPASPYRLGTVELDGYQYSVCSKASNTWVDVKVINRQDMYFDYGYDFENRRWSHNTSPKHAKVLRALILKLAASHLSSEWHVDI